MSLTNRILIAMAAGILLGSILNFLLHGPLAGPTGQWVDQYVVQGLFDVIGRIFVASLKLLVVPLVLVSLVCGSSSLGDSARMGPIAAKILAFYLATTAIAVSLALCFAVLVGPGAGVDLSADVDYQPATAPPLKEVIVDIFPTNPFKALADGNMLQIIVFALLVGYAISLAGEPGRRIAGFFRDMEAVVMKMVLVLMELAPWGVFALLTKLFAGLGLGAILQLAAYFFTVVAVLLVHALVIYSLLLRGLAGVSPRIMLNKMRPVWAFAFSTASSGATLPITLRTVEKRLGVHQSVAGFTVPLGATINMGGPAIMQGVATVFIPQVYGVDVGLITLAMVLSQAGLPVEGIALIIGVDRLLDMVRTAVNVTGDATASVVVGSSEGQLDRGVFNDPRADLDQQRRDTDAITAD